MVKEGAQGVLDNRPERLFTVGLRCTVEGFDYSDIECWETAWRTYCSEVDAVCARRLLAAIRPAQFPVVPVGVPQAQPW